MTASTHPPGPFPPNRPASPPASQLQAMPPQYIPSVLADPGRQRAVVPPSTPAPMDMEQDDFDQDAKPTHPGYGHKNLPVPEPEAQPLQRPPSGTNPQRPIRRLDRGSADQSRGNRNAP